MAWQASQTAPQFQADVGLLLTEVPYATVDTLIRTNKQVRKVRVAPQTMVFPHWNVKWEELATVVWADASNSNRPDKSSTMGIVGGCAPQSILDGPSQQVALITWRSQKTPRQVLGSNGAEVQAITEGEDLCFRLRALMAEMNGEAITRHNLHEMVKKKTKGAVIMDSRRIYDAMVRNLSSLHGLRSGRSGYELAISVAQAMEIDASLRWVNGDRQLADPLTKGGAAKKLMMQFLAGGQWWTLIHDPLFISGRNMKKRALQEEMTRQFTEAIHALATKNRWPWPHSEGDHDLGSLGNAFTRDPWTTAYA